MKPRQKKSRTYYYFWGVATLSVVLGQWYVGNGFRRMADSNDGISADINLLIESIQFQVPMGVSPDTQFLYSNHERPSFLPEEKPAKYQVFTGILFEKQD